MQNIKISPDERITQIALEQTDPFARQGQPTKMLNQHINKKQRDFSHLDEPLDNKKNSKKDKAEKPKRGRRKKVLEEIEQPTSTVFSEIITESRSQSGLPSYRAEFEGRDVFVGFPCYKTTNPVTAFAMIAMALDFGRDKIRFDMSIGDAMVYHSRNVLAEKFLQTDAKYLLMIDDDIIPCIGRPSWMRSTVVSARNVQDGPLQRHILHRLINSGKSIVGGAYFGRQENGKLMCSDQSLEKAARQYDDFIVPVDWIGTGCILIHRKVFIDIKEKFPELATNNAEASFDFFLPMAGHVGEDVAFCHRAKKAGHQPHIDLGTPVFHVGYKTY
jgi:hypothetical protein